MGRIRVSLTTGVLLVFLLSGCGYRQSIMLQADQEQLPQELKEFLPDSIAFGQNDIIKINDKIKVKVYTNDGEYILDPNFELAKEFSATNSLKKQDPEYLVKTDGTVHLPKIGNVYMEGLTLFEADTILAKKYAEFYVDPFVITEFTNRRVVVLGAGIGGMVVPLENENMNLLEVLAVYGGLDVYSKAQNIRVVRGDLSDPEVQIIDLSTVEGMTKARLAVQPNDIIYVEPWRKAFSETVRDITPVVGLLTSILTLVVLIAR